MRHSVLLEYDIGQFDWNILTKQDFVSVAEWMLSKFPIEDSACIAEVSYPTGSSSTFSLNEFKKNFSSSAEYENICIRLIAPESTYLSCSFHPHKSARLISVSAESLTLPEVEDLAQSLKSVVENLYVKREVPPLLPVQPAILSVTDIPAKVEVSLSDSEHSRLDKKNDANSKWDKRRLAIEIAKDIIIALIGALIAKMF